MKKIICIIVTFLFMHFLIFMLCFGYISYSGTFEFKEITATEQQKQAFHQNEYSLYTSDEIINVLNNCKFECVGFIEAFKVINNSNDSRIICTDLIHGEAGLFKNNQYISGRLIISNPNEVYYYVTYKNMDSKISEIDFSRTVYKVNMPADLYSQLISKETDSNKTSLKNEIFNVMWYEFTLIQKNNYIIITNVVFVFVGIGVFLITLKDYLKQKTDQGNKTG